MDQLDDFQQAFTASAQADTLRTAVGKLQCQRDVERFMEIVEDNGLMGAEGERAMDNFCEFVARTDVWPLAETVVPQFRYSKSENDKDQEEEGGDFTCLNYVLDNLHHRDRLPLRNVKHYHTTEQDLVAARMDKNIQYITTSGEFDNVFGAEYVDRLNHLGATLKGEFIAVGLAERKRKDRASHQATHVQDEEQEGETRDGEGDEQGEEEEDDKDDEDDGDDEKEGEDEEEVEDEEGEGDTSSPSISIEEGAAARGHPTKIKIKKEDDEDENIRFDQREIGTRRKAKARGTSGNNFQDVDDMEFEYSG